LVARAGQKCLASIRVRRKRGYRSIRRFEN
jgi:hypothetical protein